MTTRITGLASGLDVDSLVTTLMKARRASLDTMVGKRTTVEWQQEAYRDISTQIVDFRNNKLSNYSLSNSISAKTSEVSGNTNALAVNSTTSSASGTLNVLVNSVATAASTLIEYDAGSTTGKTLTDLGFAVDGSGNGSVSINGVSVAYSGSDKLSDLVSKINTNKGTKATAIINETTGQMSISNNATGAGTGSGGTVLLSGFPAAGFTTTETAGIDAEVSVNGITYQQASNRFSINGVDFTAKNVSGTAGTTSIKVSTDTDKILSTIKSFIADYNTLIGNVNSKLSEEKYRDYAPLTDDQKQSMTDKQIELWEGKAHSGLLRNDSILNKLVSDLRISSTAVVGGINIQSIGINTGEWSTKGQLVIEDESKLRQAIETNPDQVVALFTGTSSDKSPTSSTSGVFTKMTNTLMQTLNDLSVKAGTSKTSTDATSSFLENSLLSEQINQMKGQETDLTAKLSDIEDQYYKQFTAMESAIEKYNSQASSLTSMLS